MFTISSSEINGFRALTISTNYLTPEPFFASFFFLMLLFFTVVRATVTMWQMAWSKDSAAVLHPRAVMWLLPALSSSWSPHPFLSASGKSFSSAAHSQAWSTSPRELLGIKPSWHGSGKHQRVQRTGTGFCTLSRNFFRTDQCLRLVLVRIQS